MLRLVAFLVLLSAPAFAWEASVNQGCEIVHQGEAASVRLTYDLDSFEYAIAITLPGVWTEGSVFAMRFEGPMGNVITTNRHVISDDGTTLTVTDSGFGNVLNGLAFNETATAVLGDQSVSLDLEGAGPAVEMFRACTASLRV